jgi:hypothetical protein
MSNHNLAEALARTEHKVDLILQCLAENYPHFMLTTVADPNHICPLCQYQVTYQVDLMGQSLTRNCGCSTGMQAPLNLQPFAPPTPTESGNGQQD